MKSVSGTLGVCELGHFSDHSLFLKAEHNAAGTWFTSPNKAAEPHEGKGTLDNMCNSRRKLECLHLFQNLLF